MAKRSTWFISDRAIERPDQDELGHDDVAAQLADIVETVQAPATVGLLGGFGTGKSSIGNLLAARLAAHKRLQVVTLSGERHTGIARQRALLYSFAEALQDDANVSRQDIQKSLGKIESGEDLQEADLAALPLITFLRDNLSTLRNAISWTLLVGSLLYLVSVVAAAVFNMLREQDVNVLAAPLQTGYWSIPVLVGVVGTLLFKVFEPWITAALSPGRRTRRRPRAEAADELERIFGELAGLCPKKLVVVVDDIDRLPPEEVLEALGTIKSLQAVPKKHPPIFVIACDDEIVRRALQTADPGLSSVAGSRQRAADEYLNKLFLVRQPLPPPLREDMTNFAEKLLRSPETNHEGFTSLGESANSVLQVLIHEGVKNPRHVVRLLNAFFTDYRLATVREGSSNRLSPGSVTGSPLTLARLTVLRVDFGYAYAAVLDEYDLLAALDIQVLGGTLDRSQKDLIARANLSVAALDHEQDRKTDIEEQSEGKSNEDQPKLTLARHELPPDLADFLRRTARYVEQNVPLGPFFYLSQTGAGRILGSRRAEEIRIALENNDVETVQSRLSDDDAIANAAVDHVIASVRSSRPGLPLSNATATAASTLSSAPEARRSELAAKIAEIVAREPVSTISAPALADLIRFAPEVHRPNLISKLTDFDAAEDAAYQQAAETAQLAVEFPREIRLTEALKTFFASLPNHASYVSIRDWLPRAADFEVSDRNRILGQEFYAAIIISTVGAQDNAIPVAEGKTFAELLEQAPLNVTAGSPVLDAVRTGLAAEGAEPRWFAMLSLERLVIGTSNVSDVLERVSSVCTSTDIKAYDLTLSCGMRVIAGIARDYPSEVTEVSGDTRVQVIEAITERAESDSDKVLMAAARAAESLGGTWPDDLEPAIDALASTLDAHRSTESETGRVVQAVLLDLLAKLPTDSGDKAADALMAPIATSTDQNDPSFRMAIEASRDACMFKEGRTYVRARTSAWRQVFQGAIATPEQVRPQAEALAIAAKHSAFTLQAQQDLVTRLTALVSQDHPFVDAAAETLATIAWDPKLAPDAGEALATAWADIDLDARRRVVLDLTRWPKLEQSPNVELMDEIVRFLIESHDETREESFAKFWSWFSSDNRASALASDVSTHFRRTKLRDAADEELYDSLVAAAHSGTFTAMAHDLDAAVGGGSSVAAKRFIETSLAEEHLGWDDNTVREAVQLISESDAEDLATTAVAELGEGAARAGHAASLIAWLRLRRADQLGHINDTLKPVIIEMLPQADADLAGRLGHASTPIAKRSFNEVLRSMRAENSHGSRSAAEAFQSGRGGS